MEVNKTANNNFWYSSRIIDQGDLSTFYGYTSFDATGFTIKAGKVYPRVLHSINAIKKLDIIALLKLGYTYLKLENIPSNLIESPFPMHLISKNYKLPEFRVEVGKNPTFLLEKNGVIQHAVINGFLMDLESNKSDFKNAMIFR